MNKAILNAARKRNYDAIKYLCEYGDGDSVNQVFELFIKMSNLPRKTKDEKIKTFLESKCCSPLGIYMVGEKERFRRSDCSPYIKNKSGRNIFRNIEAARNYFKTSTNVPGRPEGSV